MWQRVGVVSLVLMMISTACAVADDQPSADDQTTIGVSTTVVTPALPPSIPEVGEGVRTTSGDTTGNRYSPGRGTVLDVQPVDNPLSGPPSWVVGAEWGEGVVWVVALDDASSANDWRPG